MTTENTKSGSPFLHKTEKKSFATSPGVPHDDDLSYLYIYKYTNYTCNEIIVKKSVVCNFSQRVVERQFITFLREPKVPAITL